MSQSKCQRKDKRGQDQLMITLLSCLCKTIDGLIGIHLKHILMEIFLFSSKSCLQNKWRFKSNLAKIFEYSFTPHVYFFVLPKSVLMICMTLWSKAGHYKPPPPPRFHPNLNPVLYLYWWKSHSQRTSQKLCHILWSPKLDFKKHAEI